MNDLILVLQLILLLLFILMVSIMISINDKLKDLKRIHFASLKFILEIASLGGKKK